MLTRAIRRLGASLALLAGCAPASLTPAGASVVVAAAPGPRCALVAMLRGSAGYNGRSSETNAAAVEAYLRNQGAERGASMLIITSRRIGAGDEGDSLSQPRGATESGGCPNCISVTANAYRCPAPAPPSVASPAVSRPPEPDHDGGYAPEPPLRDDPPFAAKAADAALAAAADSARSCSRKDGPAGEARVKVTFATTGDVVYVEVEGDPFAGSPTGECIARKFRNARVPPFSGEARSLATAVELP